MRMVNKADPIRAVASDGNSSGWVYTAARDSVNSCAIRIKAARMGEVASDEFLDHTGIVYATRAAAKDLCVKEAMAELAEELSTTADYLSILRVSATPP
jgi:hypothetical protein